jgi:hypothetical protein
VGADNEVVEFHANMFQCQATLKNSDWIFLGARMIKKRDAWIGNSSFNSTRSVLPDSSLYGVPYFYISLFMLNKSFVEKWINIEEDFSVMLKTRREVVSSGK